MNLKTSGVWWAATAGLGIGLFLFAVTNDQVFNFSDTSMTAAVAQSTAMPSSRHDVLLSLDAGTENVLTQLDKTTPISELVSCVTKETLQKEPKFFEMMNGTAACSNHHQQVIMLTAKKSILESAALEYGQRYDMQEASLKQIAALKKTDVFPSVVITAAGDEKIESIGGIADIAAKCVAIQGGRAGAQFVGRTTPELGTTPTFDPLPKKYVDKFAEYQLLVTAVEREPNQKKKDKLVEGVIDFLVANKGLAMLNTDAGLAKAPRAKGSDPKYTLGASATYLPEKTCLWGLDGYQISASGFTIARCAPFGYVKDGVTSQISSRMGEYAAQKAKFQQLALVTQKQIDRITTANPVCFNSIGLE